MNPMQIINNFISKNTNPIFKDLISKAQSGDTKSVENFARNMCKEKGVDFDKEFAKFMTNFK
jgi:hypothetical protein